MPGIKTHFWSWDAPVLDKAVAELARGWNAGELDLTRFAVIVPTAEAVRRLREALARAADAKNGAVTAPHVWHPETALLSGWTGAVIASGLEERAAWMRVLMAIDAADYPGLFPIPPVDKGVTWASSVAGMLASLRRTLGAGGHDFAGVAQLLGDHEEAARWRDLARLEGDYLGGLATMSRVDEGMVKRDIAARPVLPDEVSEVMVFAAPDLTGLMREWVRNAAKSHPVNLFIHAPADERASFDGLGAPLEEAWGEASGRLLPLRDDALRLCTAPEQQVVEAVEALREFAAAGLSSAVGACDPALNALLESELAAEGVAAYDPAGRLAGQHALADVLRAWLALCESRAWKPLAALLQRHDPLTALADLHGVPAAKLLSQLDALHADKLPRTVEDALALCDETTSPELHAVLEEVAQHLEAWTRGGSAALLRDLLKGFYGSREFDTGQEHDRSMVEMMGELMETAASLDAALGAATLGAADWLALLLAEVDRTRLTDRRGEADLVPHGWLELPWEPAAGLVIAGFNDEQVPGAVAPDPFLPDSLRRRLGLASAGSRRARDAYLLTAIAAQREKTGSLRLIVGRTTDEGDVLRPSRLLFACDDDALLGRIKLLFPEHEGMAGTALRTPRTIAWKLKPPKPKPSLELKHVSASLLSAYLKCPLRCYFSHVLRMKEVRSGLRELGGDAFGRLVHEVWRRFALNAELRDSTNAGAIAEFLVNEAGAVAREQYGTRPMFSVTLQIESARQRLRALAATQRKLREEGWIIEHAELSVKVEDGLTIGGVPFKGQIDRVDRHEKTGALRVWDYKTGREGDAGKDHLEKLRLAADGEPDVRWRALSVAADSAVVWKNLQLPLYVWAVQQRNPGVPVEAGYLHLPAVVSGTGDRPWDALDAGMVQSAVGCAEEVVKRMREGLFPPADEVAFDEWEEMLMGDAGESVADISEWREESP